MRLSGFASLALAACAAGSFAFPGAASAQQPFVPGELLVRFKPQLPSQQVSSVLGAEGADVQAKLPAVPGLRLVDLPADTSVREGVSNLERSPRVLYAEPNYRRQLFDLPDDPLFPKQWALRNDGQDVFGVRGLGGADENVTGAWQTQTGSSGVIVAMADTGMALNHPDLRGNLWTNPGEIPGNGIDDDGNGFRDDVHGWDFAENDSDPSDTVDQDQGHGSMIAGIIGAEGNNGVGIAGINWDVSLMPVRTPLSVAGELAAFAYASSNGARVLNYSAGSAQASSSELAAINAYPNVLFVIAAGNDRSNNDANPIYPCSYSSANIICVASTNQGDGLSSFSNFGPTSVDLAAPGENILSTFPAGGISDQLRDSFGQLPLSARWKAGGTGRKWRLTRRLDRGYSLADSPHGRYRNNTNSWIRSNAIDLSAQRSCVLGFYLKLSTASRKDRLVVEASSDDKHFRHIHSYSRKHHGIRVLFLPRRFDGKPAVQLRFRLRTDKKRRADGAYVDNVELSCQASADTYAYEDGTSFSSPQVAGAAGLVLAEHPGFSTAEVRSALLAGVDPLPGLSGKVATGGRLDAAGAVTP
jgi:subtilisin family serine protease